MLPHSPPSLDGDVSAEHLRRSLAPMRRLFTFRDFRLIWVLRCASRLREDAASTATLDELIFCRDDLMFALRQS